MVNANENKRKLRTINFDQ